MVAFFYKSKKLRVRVAGYIQNQEGKILLIKQKKRNKDYWLLPGGGIEFGESAPAALIRELKEELNLDTNVGDFLMLNENIDPRGERHLIQLVFRASILPESAPIKLSDSAVIEFCYFTLDEMKKLEMRPDIRDHLDSIALQKSFYVKSDWISD